MKNPRNYRSHRSKVELRKTSNTLGITEPNLNFENFRHCKATLNYEKLQHFRSNRSNTAELRKTSDPIGITEPKLNSGYV